VLLRRVPPLALVDDNLLTDILLGSAVASPTIESETVTTFDDMPGAALTVSLDHTVEDTTSTRAASSGRRGGRRSGSHSRSSSSRDLRQA
jgi:hypothetical protein